MLNDNAIQSLRQYFANQPVSKVWVYGSFARSEENNNSDVDLLVSFDSTSKVTLFTMGGMYMDLKRLLGREVDLVEEGTLEDYAAATAEKDKRLIYERAK